jgi:primosomal protein N'
MKSIRVMSTAALFLLFGIAAPAYGRQEKPEEKAPPPKQQQAKPEKQQEAAKPPKQEQAKAPKQEAQAKPEKQQQAKAPKQQQEAKPEKQQQAAKTPKQEQQAKPEKQQQQAKTEQQQKSNSAKQQQAHQQQAHQQQTGSSHAPQRTQQAMATQRAQPALRLSARGSGRIPDDRFRASFGREHNFHMGNPVLVGGYSRFQYGGFWFGFVQPWPVGWYYTDDVYIDYVDGGYYMYNPYYPGARFSLSVVI